MDDRTFWLRLWQSIFVIVAGTVLGVLAMVPGCNRSAAERWERRCNAVREAAPKLDPSAQVLLVDRAFPTEGRMEGSPK